MADKHQSSRSAEPRKALAGSTPAPAVTQQPQAAAAHKKVVRKKTAVSATKKVSRKKAAPAAQKTAARKKTASRRAQAPAVVGAAAKPVLSTEQRQRMVSEAAYLISLKRPPHLGSPDIDWLSAETVIDMIFAVKD